MGWFDNWDTWFGSLKRESDFNYDLYEDTWGLSESQKLELYGYYIRKKYGEDAYTSKAWLEIYLIEREKWFKDFKADVLKKSGYLGLLGYYLSKPFNNVETMWEEHWDRYVIKIWDTIAAQKEREKAEKKKETTPAPTPTPKPKPKPKPKTPDTKAEDKKKDKEKDVVKPKKKEKPKISKPRIFIPKPKERKTTERASPMIFWFLESSNYIFGGRYKIISPYKNMLSIIKQNQIFS